METLPVFPDLTPQELEALLERAVVRTYGKNAVVVIEGDEGNSVYFVLKGRVKVFLSNEQGREVIIGQLGPGDYFGEMAIESGYRSASVMTLEPCQFAVVKIDEFREFVQRHPDFMFALLEKLIRRSRTMAQNVKSLALLNVYGRLTQLLNEQARQEGGCWVIDPPMTQQALANRIGSSREMISRIFKDLITGGYLAVSRNRIEIKRRLPTTW